MSTAFAQDVSPSPALVFRSEEGELADGLRALLVESARLAGADLSRPSGYERSDDTRVPPPPELEAAAMVLRVYGYGRFAVSLQDDINHGLEKAAGKAAPAVEAAAAQLDIRDVRTLVTGEEPLATQLLCSEGREAFLREYATVLKAGLAEAGYYTNLKLLIDNYNSIPPVPDMETPDLEPGLRERGVNGLCLRMADQERKLRSDPEARTNEAVRRLFAGPGALQPVVPDTASGGETRARDRKRDKQEAEAAKALRELLVFSLANAQRAQAKPGGYLKNPKVKIGLPEQLQPMAKALAAAGMPKYAEDLVVDLNVAAEITAGKALPLLQKALDSLVLRDTLITMQGDDAAAMREFRRQTESQLLAGFQPIMQDSLRRAGTYDSFRALAEAYYKQPGASKILFDLELYARERFIDGLYVRIGDEEGALRHALPEDASKTLRKVLALPKP